MAKVYRRVGGKSFEKAIAMHRDVQESLDRHVFQAAVRAEADLQRRREEPFEIEGVGRATILHGSSIDIEIGKTDRSLVLEDRPNIPADLNPLVRNLNTALSIEYGREAGSKTITMKDSRGRVVHRKVKWGHMDGLFILHHALGVKAKKPKKGGRPNRYGSTR